MANPTPPPLLTGRQLFLLISKTSGVSEVLVHALKADFWDIDDMADKIIAVLRHPILSDTLKERGSFEVRGISWDGTATKCVQTYTKAIADRVIERSG